MNGEQPRVSESKVRKARQLHFCYECQRMIKVGDTYNVIKGNWEGKWYKFKTCLSCAELRNELEYDGELAPFGNLYEWAAEAGIEFPVK
jgi:hypothetical protein